MYKFDAVIKSNKYYPLQVWLLTILLAPILFLLIRITIVGTPAFEDGVVKGILYFIVFGALYSLPSFFVFYLFYKFLIRQKISEMTVKLLLFILAALLAFFTYKLVIEGSSPFHNSDWDDFALPGIYSISILFSCLLYRIRKAS